MIAPAQHRATFQRGNRELYFVQSDVVGEEDLIPVWEDNPDDIRPWFVHDRGECLAVVYAGDGVEAIHIAADEGRLDSFLIEFDDDTPQSRWRDYDATEQQAIQSCRLSLLGDYGLPFDVESVECFALPTPAISIVAFFRSLG